MTAPAVQARLAMTCACGAGQDFVDEDLAVTDALRIRSWTSLHAQPGHTITATITAAYEAPGTAPAHLATHAGSLVRGRLAVLLTHLHPSS